MTEMMAENKRYEIVNSKIIEDAFNIKDNKGKHSFPSVKDKSTLVMYEKTLNEQEELIKRLKQIREEQTETILKQKRKIKELTTQLTTDDEDVCFYCKHMYLVQQNDGYYISKCKKGFDECSKGTIKYCKDFELKGDVE